MILAHMYRRIIELVSAAQTMPRYSVTLVGMQGNQKISPPFYTKNEEWANSISHGIGAGLSIYGLYILLVLGVSVGDTWRVVGFSLYGFSLVFVFLSSTLYHSFQHPPVKHFFRLMDHAGIFLMIAETIRRSL